MHLILLTADLRLVSVPIDFRGLAREELRREVIANLNYRWATFRVTP